MLQKAGEQHTRQSSADSSGCSSGQESVTSSLTSNSHVSSDSGADVDPIAVSPNKLLEIATAWSPTSLRQRNVGNVRPGGTTDSARWDPYVKVAKTGEPILAETLSIARSTPNLTDTTGSTTSQHTWSSTGYMSMPSSEEVSNNPSPLPNKENPNLGCYSVVGVVPDPIRSKSEENTGRNESLVVSTTESKSSNPYVSLASLEHKPKGITVTESLPDFEDITFPEESSNIESLSDKVSKPYVQSGFVDIAEKPKVSIAPTLVAESCSKPLVSTVTSIPVTTHLPPDTSSKPYVAVSSIPEITKQPRVASSAAEIASKPYIPIESASSSVFQMLQQQRSKSDFNNLVPEMEDCDVEVIGSEEDDFSTFSLCWQPKPSEDEFKTEVKSKSRGYVTMSENPKLEQPVAQNQRFGKQQTNTQSEEQYSKVTLAPGTMQ